MWKASVNQTEMLTTTRQEESSPPKNVISRGLLPLMIQTVPLKTIQAVSVTGFIQLPYSSTYINNHHCTSIALNRRNH